MTTSSIKNNTHSSTLPLLFSLISVSLVLLGIVDFRRGFLFAADAYWFKNSFCVISTWNLLLIGAGVVGIQLSIPKLKNLPQAKNKLMIIGLLLILIVDFIFYRGVAASRALDAGKIGIGWLNPLSESSALTTLNLSVSYLLTIWHASLLSCLLASLALIAIPRFAFFKVNSRWKGTLLGTLFSLTQPLCSCCAMINSTALFRPGMAKGFGISMLLGAPLLNLSTLFLAGTLLPLPFAFVRIFGGILVTFGTGLLISYLYSENICAVENEFSKSHVQELDNPGVLLKEWILNSGKIALWLMPSILLGTFLTSLFWNFWPADLTNSAMSVGIASLLGGLLMISTWSEIPLALKMIEQGATGPAAAVLIALPALNLASLFLMAKITKDWKLVFGVGAMVTAASFAIGMIFI